MNRFFIIFSCICFLVAGCAAPELHPLRIVSIPSDALVVLQPQGQGAADVPSSRSRLIAGTTPLEKSFDFGKSQQLQVEVEKRGWLPQREAVSAGTGKISIRLRRAKTSNGTPAKEYAFPLVHRLLLVTPDIQVVERGFSNENVSTQKSFAAEQAITDSIRAYFSGRWQVISFKPADHKKKKEIRTLWRDVEPAMMLLNPIELKYRPKPPLLETNDARKAAFALGREFGAEAILFVSGKENVETAGMVAGKLGMAVVGTANSYAAGYSQAMARGDSCFSYTIYTPTFAAGTSLNALLVDSKNGEILWKNSGLWGAIAFGRTTAVKNVLRDLFTGIPEQATKKQ